MSIKYGDRLQLVHCTEYAEKIESSHMPRHQATITLLAEGLWTCFHRSGWVEGILHKVNSRMLFYE